MRWLRRSDPRRLFLFAGSVVLVSLLVPLPHPLPSVTEANRLILPDDGVQAEDWYAVADIAAIEGTVRGDLTLAAGRVFVGGRIEGDLMVASRGTVRIDGVVTGSARILAPRVIVTGSIGDDLAVASISTRVQGRVGRDLLMTGLELDVDGFVGRDVIGQILDIDVRGEVARSLDVQVRRVALAGSARIGDDIVLRSDNDVDAEPGAVVAGTVIRRSSRSVLAVRVVRRVAAVVVLAGFVVLGLGLLWLFRGTSGRAVAAIESEPGRTLGYGAAALMAVPLLVLGLTVTLVGAVPAVLLTVVWLLAFVLGPLPALAAAGRRLARGRGGLLGGFALGALVWGLLLWLMPTGGGLLTVAGMLAGIDVWPEVVWLGLAAVPFLAAVAWGTGGWMLGAAAMRSEAPWDRSMFGSALLPPDSGIQPELPL